MQARAHRSFRDAQHTGDVARFQFFYCAEQQNGAQLFREAINFVTQAIPEFALRQDAFHRGQRRSCRFVPRSVPTPCPRRGSPMIERQPVSHSGDPRAKLFWVAEPGELAISTEKGVLHNLLRVGAITKHCVSHMEDEAMEFADAVLEVNRAMSFIAQACGPSSLSCLASHGEKAWRMCYCFWHGSEGGGTKYSATNAPTAG